MTWAIFLQGDGDLPDDAADELARRVGRSVRDRSASDADLSVVSVTTGAGGGATRMLFDRDSGIDDLGGDGKSAARADGSDDDTTSRSGRRKAK